MMPQSQLFNVPKTSLDHLKEKFGSINQLITKRLSRKSVFDIYFTEFGTALTTILPILFQHCYKYCYSDSRNL